MFSLYLLSFGPVLALVAKYELEESAIKYPLIVYVPLAYICLEIESGLSNPKADELESEYLAGHLEIGF